MNSLKIVVVAAAVLAVAFCADTSAPNTNIKEEGAGGYGLPAPIYDQPQPYYGYDGYFPYTPNFLVDNHFCSFDVSYLVYGGVKKHNRHPFQHSCDAVFKGKNKKNKKRYSCKRCCQNAARLNGVSQKAVTGFEVVINERARCTCCAPITQAVAQPLVQPFMHSMQAAAPSAAY